MRVRRAAAIGLVWGAGLFASDGFADRSGPAGALSASVPPRGERAPVRGRGEVLVERHDVLAGVPRPDRAAAVTGVAAVLGDLASVGIRDCTDATHTNDLAALELLADAVAAEPAVPVTAMVGADQLASLGHLSFGMAVEGAGAGRTGPGSVRIGHAKVMPPHDDDSVIGGLVATARAHDFPVAVHVMDIDTLHAALDALEAHPQPIGATQPDRSGSDRIEPDRIEHRALALPEQLDRISGTCSVRHVSGVCPSVLRAAGRVTRALTAGKGS